MPVVFMIVHKYIYATTQALLLYYIESPAQRSTLFAHVCKIPESKAFFCILYFKYTFYTRTNTQRKNRITGLWPGNSASCRHTLQHDCHTDFCAIFSIAVFLIFSLLSSAKKTKQHMERQRWNQSHRSNAVILQPFPTQLFALFRSHFQTECS